MNVKLKYAVKSTLATVDLGVAANDSVLFTFDDGPHPQVTPAVLETLRAAGAIGIFFVVGKRIARAPYLLSQILAEGHIIGNHTYSHDGASLADLRACQRAVRELTGYEPKLFRPAQGKLTIRSVLSAWCVNLKTVLWSVDSGDWRAKDPAASAAVAQRLTSRLLGIRERKEIVLLHDDNPSSVVALQACLPPLIENGCDLVSAAARLA